MFRKIFVKILVWMSSLKEAIVQIFPRRATYWSVFWLVFLLLILVGCSTTRTIPQVVEHTARDTLYIGSTQYDSIYRNDSFVMDYHPSKEFIYLLDSILIMKVDTMYIRDKNVEYKYKYLHDTTYIHRIDSIPVIREVEVVRTERYVPTVYKYALVFSIIIILLIILSIVRKFL